LARASVARLLLVAPLDQEITTISRSAAALETRSKGARSEAVQFRVRSRLKLVKQPKVGAKIGRSVVSPPSRTRAQRALSPTAYPEARNTRVGRWVGCAAFLSLLAAAETSGCGSKSDLFIGRNAAATTQAGSDAAGGGTGGSSGTGGGGGAEPTAGAPDADASDTEPDAQPDASDDAPTTCASNDIAPSGSLLHRYSFDGTGTVAKDSAGTADGDLKPGATLDGKGMLTLDGVNGYVNLPNHLISVLNEVTFVTWTTFLGGSGFERIFDFGVGVGEDDTSGQGVSYLAVAPYGGESRLLMLAKEPTMSEIQITSAANVSDNTEHQVALVFVSASHAELYLDGQLLSRSPVPFSLSVIDDVNDWIGRSQWVNDHSYNGTVDEFRIYGQALTPCAIQALYDAGPTAL
jgi:concanavalin A-like lectin/glucanase superfamily protein